MPLKMKRFVLALSVPLVSLLASYPVIAEVTPYEQTVAAFSISMCLKEYGYPEDVQRKRFTYAVSSIDPQVLSNITKDKNFYTRVRQHTQDSGGCKALVGMVREAAGKALNERR